MGGQLNLSIERTVSLGSLKYIGMSSLRDDWVAFVLGSNSEPDIFFSCVFKTELVTRLTLLMRGLDIRIGPTVDWAKKPGKMTTIKFVKDPKVPRDDVYKSSTVYVPEGLPPNSGSRPTPRGRSAAASYRPPAQQQRQQQQFQPPPQQQQQQYRRSPQQQQNGFPAVVQESAQRARVPIPQQATRAQPPPPPPPPPMQPPAPVQTEPIYRALYDFTGQTASELSFSKGEVLEINKKEGNGIRVPSITLTSGWWLAKRNGQEGWVPQNYLKEEIPPSPAPALRPAPAPVRQPSPVMQKPAAPKPPVVMQNGPVAPKPPVANGGFPSAPRPQTTTGRKVPPPAPSTRPTRTNKPAPPPAPPAKQAAGTVPQPPQVRPNLAANLADMVFVSLSIELINS